MTLANTERRIGKTEVRLTARGKRVRNIAIAILVLLVASWLNELSTPEVCKVPIEKMSYECKSLLYP